MPFRIFATCASPSPLSVCLKRLHFIEDKSGDIQERGRYESRLQFYQVRQVEQERAAQINMEAWWHAPTKPDRQWEIALSVLIVHSTSQPIWYWSDVVISVYLSHKQWTLVYSFVKYAHGNLASNWLERYRKLHLNSNTVTFSPLQGEKSTTEITLSISIMYVQ